MVEVLLLDRDAVFHTEKKIAEWNLSCILRDSQPTCLAFQSVCSLAILTQSLQDFEMRVYPRHSYRIFSEISLYLK